MRLLIFFVAFALAIGAFLFTLHVMSEKAPPTTTTLVQQPVIPVKEIPKVKVFVARQDIAIGTSAKRAMLDIVDYQQNLVLPDMAVVQDEGASPVDGMVARSPVVKGEVILKSKFANPKDPSYLAGSLGEGMRLATIGVDNISGGGGFINPGDRVDVLVTRDIHSGGSLRMPVSEVLIPNVRVMAVNLRNSGQVNDTPTIPNNVSLEVSQLDVQRLRLVESGNGKISLALRSLLDKQDAGIARPVGLDDLSRTTPASYFPTLYENLNSYTPRIVTTAPGGNTESSTSVVSAAPAGAAGAESANTIDIIRGTKRESVPVSSPF